MNMWQSYDTEHWSTDRFEGYTALQKPEITPIMR
jgi:hypothetical protein